MVFSMKLFDVCKCFIIDHIFFLNNWLDNKLCVATSFPTCINKKQNFGNRLPNYATKYEDDQTFNVAIEASF